MSFSATAFMCVYNEADILPWTLQHLLEQGVDVHVIDNWSTDRSADIVKTFPLVGFERFPADGPSKYYSWRLLLRRVEELASLSKADWLIHHDADEIRRSPRTGETLIQGLERVDRDGFEAINHKVYHFMPTDDTYAGDPEKHFKHYLPNHDNTTSRQIKAWKRTAGRNLALADSGGHVAFYNAHTCPELFVMKHYPMRTRTQAERKVVKERIERYDPVELAMNWHVQYRQIAQTRDWIKPASTLHEWTD